MWPYTPEKILSILRKIYTNLLDGTLFFIKMWTIFQCYKAEGATTTAHL